MGNRHCDRVTYPGLSRVGTECTEYTRQGFRRPKISISVTFGHIGMPEMTYVPKNDWGNYSVMVSHSNVALELGVLVADFPGTSLKFRLAQSGYGLVTDGSVSDANFRRDGCAEKVFHGIVAQLRQHESSFAIIRTYVSFCKGIKWIKE